jgi:hypothetical protein
MQKRGIMSEEFGPDDAAERERQAYNAEDTPVPPCPGTALPALTPQPVRVRFVDLPHRHREAKGPFGNPLHVAEPGGFALVVDRFKHLAHLEGERERWEAWGAAIGAHSVVLYPGELDVIGWLDNV